MFTSKERKLQLAQINALETWEEIQQWCRNQPIMEGFYRGAHAGWKNTQLINDMYKVFANAMGLNTWYTKIVYLCASFFSIGGGAGLGLGMYLIMRSESLDHLPVSEYPWYVPFGLGILIIGGLGLVTAFAYLLTYKYNKVQIPVSINKYNPIPNKPWPLERALIQAPRLAWIAEHEMYYFGPQGGNVETAELVRLQTLDDLKNEPAKIIYSLRADANYAADSPARYQRAKVLEVKRAARLRPKTQAEKYPWLNRKNAFTGLCIILLVVCIIFYGE